MQREAVEILGAHYGFSPRLVQLLCTAPPSISDPLSSEVPTESKSSTINVTDDIERGEKCMLQNVTKPQQHKFYNIARGFKSYQSIDIGEKCEQS